MNNIKTTLFLLTIIFCQTMMAEVAMSYLGYVFTDRQCMCSEEDCYGKSTVRLGNGDNCLAFFYTNINTARSNYMYPSKDAVWISTSDTTETGYVSKGKLADGTYFVEKLFFDRPSADGIIFYQVPEECYEELSVRLEKSPFIPLELFHATYLSLMDYKLVSVGRYSYEEGRNGVASIVLRHTPNTTVTCFCLYSQGAMIALPQYKHQIKEWDYVQVVDMDGADNQYAARTGETYYGKAPDGTYFVEKDFNRLSQSIIIYKIPEEYFEEVIDRLVSLPQLPTYLF